MYMQNPHAKFDQSCWYLFSYSDHFLAKSINFVCSALLKSTEESSSNKVFSLKIAEYQYFSLRILDSVRKKL